MPLYHYRCPSCRDTYLRHAPMSQASERPPCPECSVPLNRVYDFTYAPDIPEHFSHTTGTVIRGKRNFSEELKRLSAEASERTGVYHNYVPADYTDPASLGVTSEGLEHTFRTKHNAGIRTGEEAAKWL